MITKTSEVKAHAKFSASGSSRWMNCAGSMNASEGAPPQRENAYATEGTDAHACLEFLFKNRKEARSAIKKAKLKYDDDMINHALETIAWVGHREIQNPFIVTLCETRVDASPFTCDDQFGTLDLALVEEFGRLTVIDYKYGAGIAVDVGPEDNTQMIYYALGLSFQYDHNFKEVELVIIQPRAYHESGETIRSRIYTMEELLSWVPKFKAAVKATEDPFAPLKAGSWCKYCPAALKCPELKGRALQQAQIVFDDETSAVESVPAPETIAIRDLGLVLDACEKIENWIGRVRDHAEHVLERGEDVQGWKLVEKRSTRKWTEPDKVAKEAKKLWGELAFTSPELLSPAQLEKAVAKSPLSDKWIEKRVSNKSSGTTLVRDTDKRPAVKAIENAFSIVDKNGKEIPNMETQTTASTTEALQASVKAATSRPTAKKKNAKKKTAKKKK